jgi:hypothetical protein
VKSLKSKWGCAGWKDMEGENNSKVAAKSRAQSFWGTHHPSPLGLNDNTGITNNNNLIVPDIRCVDLSSRLGCTYTTVDLLNPLPLDIDTEISDASVPLSSKLIYIPF